MVLVKANKETKELIEPEFKEQEKRLRAKAKKGR